ncbi:hypothetical protein C7S15_5075 [Burkholderia cepacia]|nr:hypothetical protein [Burkholderia cepacia]
MNLFPVRYWLAFFAQCQGARRIMGVAIRGINITCGNSLDRHTNHIESN